tara:strand:+ start:7490 stop:8125 length:636 start_codon:yes stop_codon:yes gene_type:complete
MEIALIKHSLITIGKGIVILLALAFIFTRFGGCDDKIEVVKTDNSMYFAKMKADSIKSLANDIKIKSLEAKLTIKERSEDSLVTLAYDNQRKADKSAKKVRDLIKKGVCDTVEILIALNDCDSVKLADNRAMASKDSTNQVLIDENEVLKEDNVLQKGMVETARTIIKNQAEDYKALEKESKKALRKQKIKTIGAIIVASITEVLTIFVLK